MHGRSNLTDWVDVPFSPPDRALRQPDGSLVFEATAETVRTALLTDGISSKAQSSLAAVGISILVGLMYLAPIWSTRLILLNTVCARTRRGRLRRMLRLWIAGLRGRSRYLRSLQIIMRMSPGISLIVQKYLRVGAFTSLYGIQGKARWNSQGAPVRTGVHTRRGNRL